jgi:hypothetical protein
MPAKHLQWAQARSNFEMYASGQLGLTAISRSLEERGVATRMVVDRRP